MNRALSKQVLLSGVSFLLCAGLYLIPDDSDDAVVSATVVKYPAKQLKFGARIPVVVQPVTVESAAVDEPPVARPPVQEKVEPISGGAIRRRERYIGLIQREAKKNGLPAEIADAVAYVESRYDETQIGSVGEIGLMQVRPATAAMMGFRGNDFELALPAVNIHYGVSYLAQAWRLAGGDLCRALMKYRAGHGEERMTLKSVSYCQTARIYLARAGQNGAALAMAPPPAAEQHPVAAYMLPVGGAPKTGHRVSCDPVDFWAAHEARIRLLKERVHAKWRQIALGHTPRPARVVTASNDRR